MTGSNKVKIVADGGPEEENVMTSSSTSCSRPVSWLHLCVIYSLLGVYGLWTVTSYQLIRSSLLDELQRGSPVVAGDLGLRARLDDDTAAVRRRRRRSADDSQVTLNDVPSLSRDTRETGQSGRRTGNRRRRFRYEQRTRTQSESEARGVPRRPQHGRRGRADGRTTYRFWRKADWVSTDVFQLNEETGHVAVLQPGVYLIYAQMVYHDRTGRWSFGVYVDSREVVKCLSSEQLRDARSLHPTSHGVYQQCNTATTTHLDKHQTLHVRCMYGARTILTQPEFTFWGVVKLS